MEEEEIVSKDCYYKNEPDNEFYNYTTHGLNIEGIKKYCLNPNNSKYYHLVQLNKDLKKIIENSKILQKERQKKLDINNRYDDERLIKMYTINKEKENAKDKINISYKQFNTLDNKLLKNNEISKSSKIFEKNNSLDKPVEIKLEKNFDNRIGKKELKRNILNKNIFIDNSGNKMRNINKYGIGPFSQSFNTNKSINTCYSLRKINKFQNTNQESKLPLIKPRKIIIEYNLTNDAGVGKENKKYGHNNYMGPSYNPFNYSFTPKNRNKRNVYGGLFLH